jgi:probable F420-dependent oxidoreductase
MKFILQYPEPIGIETDFFTGGEVGEVALAAEDAGFDVFAMTEHPIPGARWAANGGHQCLDPLIGLTYAGARTRTIQLLTYLVIAAYRNPFLLAKSAASVDLLSNGRLILGIGAGYQKSEFFALGAPFEQRGALLDEALEVLPLHWSGEPFDYKGHHFDARHVIGLPKPQRQIPIWIGGNAAPTLRRVARHAQGWMPLTGTPTLFTTTGAPELVGDAALAQQIKTIRDMADERAAGLAFAVSYEEVGKSIVPADVQRHRERIAALESLGVTHLALSVDSLDADSTRRWIEEFGANFIRS